MSSTEIGEALMVAGWLLALQVASASEGEDPSLPRVCLAHKDDESIRLVNPRAESEVYKEHIQVGHIFIEKERSNLSYWAFAYDSSAGSFPGTISIEVGWGSDPVITFVQRFSPLNGDQDFKLIGDLERVDDHPIPALAEELGTGQELLLAGASDAEDSGEVWSALYDDRDLRSVALELGSIRFRVPDGWSFRRGSEGQWVLSKILPWEYIGAEPTILLGFLEYPDQPSLDDLLEDKKSELKSRGIEPRKSEASQLQSLQAPLRRLAWTDDIEDQRVRSEFVWIALSPDSLFLAVISTSCRDIDDATSEMALEAVLASIEVPT